MASEEDVLRQLGTTWEQTGLVVVSTIGIYLTFILLVRLVGQRSLASMSSFDFGAAVAAGAVLGRTVLLYTPTLTGGVAGLTTLFACQGALGLLRRNRAVDRALNRTPLLLMDGALLLHNNMRRAHVAEDEIRQRLRLAGIRRLDEVLCVVLERNGSVSVLREGAPLEPWLLADVAGRERLASGGPGQEQSG
jgi:uncharacterized membrane protein YcaP (DUF421 family)